MFHDARRRRLALWFPTDGVLPQRPTVLAPLAPRRLPLPARGADTPAMPRRPTKPPPEPPSPAALPRWTIHKAAHRLIWVGEVEALDEAAAIEKAAEELRRIAHDLGIAVHRS